MITISGSDGKSFIVEAIKQNYKDTLVFSDTVVSFADYFIPKTFTAALIVETLREITLRDNPRNFVIIYTHSDGSLLMGIVELIDRMLDNEYLANTLVFVHR